LQLKHDSFSHYLIVEPDSQNPINIIQRKVATIAKNSTFSISEPNDRERILHRLASNNIFNN